jgi:hypothetical protein
MTDFSAALHLLHEFPNVSKEPTQFMRQGV